MRVLLIGLSHHSASLDVRERFAVDDPEPLLSKLVDCDEIDEALLLSTCNRTEVLALSRQPEAARHRIHSFFRREIGGDAPLPGGVSLDDVLYEHLDSRAMRHVFRVASSLDSLVVGEPQILGQVKDAYRAAVRAGACGVILHRLMSRAFATAKRVRNETGVAERPISVARVAVDLAGQIFETLGDKTALLIGAGEMGEIALGAMRDDGLERVLVANRTVERARELAERHGTEAHGLDALPMLLEHADVVLASTGGSDWTLGAEAVTAVMEDRPHRPMFVIDIAVPRSVDPGVNEIEGVYLYDIDDLESVANTNVEQRRKEMAQAESIVSHEQQAFDGWMGALRAVPTIRNLRARGEAIRLRELERTLRRLDLDEAQRDAVDALTRGIVNKLLHAPVSRLRAEADREEGIAYLEAARELFALGDPDAPGAEADDTDTADDE